jgi:hypothetical protein
VCLPFAGDYGELVASGEVYLSFAGLGLVARLGLPGVPAMTGPESHTAISSMCGGLRGAPPYPKLATGGNRGIGHPCGTRIWGFLDRQYGGNEPVPANAH